MIGDTPKSRGDLSKRGVDVVRDQGVNLEVKTVNTSGTVMCVIDVKVDV
jgi:hypothetical protein